MDRIPEADLLTASEQIDALVGGTITFQQFVSLYDNYYYAAALDGHEGGEDFLQFLESNRLLVELHARIQQVLDKVYIPSSESDVDARYVGRLGIDEARQQIVELTERHGFTRELLRLRARTRRDREG